MREVSRECQPSLSEPADIVMVEAPEPAPVANDGRPAGSSNDAPLDVDADTQTG